MEENIQFLEWIKIYKQEEESKGDLEICLSEVIEVFEDSNFESLDEKEFFEIFIQKSKIQPPLTREECSLLLRLCFNNGHLSKDSGKYQLESLETLNQEDESELKPNLVIKPIKKLKTKRSKGSYSLQQVTLKIIQESNKSWTLNDICQELNNNWIGKVYNNRRKEYYSSFTEKIVLPCLKIHEKFENLIEKDSKYEYKSKFRLYDAIVEIMKTKPGYWWKTTEIFDVLSLDYKNKVIPDKIRCNDFYQKFKMHDIYNELKNKKSKDKFISNDIGWRLKDDFDQKNEIIEIEKKDEDSVEIIETEKESLETEIEINESETIETKEPIYNINTKNDSNFNSLPQTILIIIKESNKSWSFNEILEELNTNWKGKIYNNQKKECYTSFSYFVVKTSLHYQVKRAILIEKDSKYEFNPKTFKNFNIDMNALRLNDAIEEIMKTKPDHWWTPSEILDALNLTYKNKVIPNHKSRTPFYYEKFILSDVSKGLIFKKNQSKFIVRSLE